MKALNPTNARRLALATAAVMLSAVAQAQATPQWLSPQTLSQPGQDTTGQQVAFDPRGDAVVVWQGTGVHKTILATGRPAGGAFSSPQTLSDPSQDSTIPDVAIDAQGDAVAVWLRFDGSNERVQSAYRPAGGSFGAPQTLSAAGNDAAEPRVAMNGGGDAVVVWSLRSGVTAKIQAAQAGLGGGFGAAVDLTGFTSAESVPQVALDLHGDAIAVWDGSDGANIRIEEALRPAAGSFGAPRFLSPAGFNADNPQVAFDSSGNALAVWRFDGPPASTAQGAYRPAGGEFGPVQTISAPVPHPAQRPQVAFDGQGYGVVAWQQEDGIDPRVYASVRSPGASGAFSPQSAVDPGGQEALEPRIAGDGLSAVILSWKTFNGITSSTQAAVRPAGGSFGPAATVSSTGAEEGTPEVGVDAQGNGIAVWSRFNATNYMLEAAGYDGAGPLLRGLTLPSRGVVGQSLQFFVAPLDVWNPVLSEGFTFGDGGSASGVSATHAYGAPGSYQVSATATDVLGNVTTATQTVTIATPGVASNGRCALSAPRSQKLLRKGTITASVDCSVSLEAALSGHLTVATGHSHSHSRRHARDAARSRPRNYALEGSRIQVAAGLPATIHLTLSTRTLHAVLAALGRHRRVGLALVLTGAGGTEVGVRTEAQIAAIASARTASSRGTGGKGAHHRG
ncbi:MAG TPA: PKD domain-containing protein [Candidatus Acidoferrales bacterium]|jgi:hypothetical protein|nr:PKD domain-containing protein [Candidatus Acidoferrales bacterium]